MCSLPIEERDLTPLNNIIWIQLLCVGRELKDLLLPREKCLGFRLSQQDNFIIYHLYQQLTFLLSSLSSFSNDTLNQLSILCYLIPLSTSYNTTFNPPSPTPHQILPLFILPFVFLMLCNLSSLLPLSLHSIFTPPFNRSLNYLWSPSPDQSFLLIFVLYFNGELYHHLSRLLI